MKKKLHPAATVVAFGIILLDLIMVGLFIYECIKISGFAAEAFLRAILLLAASVFTLLRFFGVGGYVLTPPPIAYYRSHYKTYLAGAFLDDPRREKLFFCAVDRYANSNYSAAVRGFAKLLKGAKSPADSFALLAFLGFSYEDMQMYDRALTLYRRALTVAKHPAIELRISHCEEQVKNQEQV